jgi:DNA-binding XRE family transcriptional regulator
MIKTARKKPKLTQGQLGELVGVKKHKYIDLKTVQGM